MIDLAFSDLSRPGPLASSGARGPEWSPIDVGLPVVFWQQRPGQVWAALRAIYSSAPCRPGHDALGNRIADSVALLEHRQFLAAQPARRAAPALQHPCGRDVLRGPSTASPSQISRLGSMSRLVGAAGTDGLGASQWRTRDFSLKTRRRSTAWYIMNASHVAGHRNPAAHARDCDVWRPR